MTELSEVLLFAKRQRGKGKEAPRSMTHPVLSSSIWYKGWTIKLVSFFFLKVSKIKKKYFSSAKYSHNLKIKKKKKKSDQLYGPPYIANYVRQNCRYFLGVVAESRICNNFAVDFSMLQHGNPLSFTKLTLTSIDKFCPGHFLSCPEALFAQIKHNVSISCPVFPSFHE
jgi:hypothetical protein